MSILLLLVMVLLGLAGSFLAGMFGIGGAIINYPLLLFVPPALGLAGFTTLEVSAISMFQVFFSALSGVLTTQLTRKRKPDAPGVHRKLVFYMGGSILAGSLLGGLASGYIAGNLINITYGGLAILAIVLMLVPPRGTAPETGENAGFPAILAVVLAFLVGIVSGIVGAGGAFLLIPIMLTVLNIPVRTAIVSSLAIVLLSAVGGVAGKLATGGLPVLPTLFTVIGCLIGAPLGSRVAAKMDTRALRYGLVAIIAATAVKVWFTVLF
ncbi:MULTISPECIES: sulfite exporter TauE/SafE family protein [Paenibacillus]|uniref:sulfite exporter TauE/SafE family protein n=1 Tax=Paenibacillus TaxID=44249 RepID=UPI002FE1D3A0